MNDASAENDLGPKMLACSELERAFVNAVLDYPTAKREKWARVAGYGGPNATPLSLRQRGHHVAHRQSVQEAIHEETWKRLRLGGAIGIAGLVKVAQNPKHKGHQKACAALADRAGFAAQQNINVKHEHTDMTGAAMAERIRALAMKFGMDPAALLGGNTVPDAKLVELTAVEVKDGNSQS